MSPENISRRFSYHAPDSEEKKNAHGAIRNGCKELAFCFNEKLPRSREASLAITKLEEAMFWANAALARPRDDSNAEVPSQTP